MGNQESTPNHSESKSKNEKPKKKSKSKKKYYEDDDIIYYDEHDYDNLYVQHSQQNIPYQQYQPNNYNNQPNNNQYNQQKQQVYQNNQNSYQVPIMAYPNSSENSYDNGHINNQKLFSSRMDMNIYSHQNDNVPQRRNEIFMENITNIGSRTSQDQYYNDVKNSRNNQHQNLNVYSSNRTPLPMDRPMMADDDPRIRFDETTMVQYNPSFDESGYNQQQNNRRPQQHHNQQSQHHNQQSQHHNQQSQHHNQQSQHHNQQQQQYNQQHNQQQKHNQKQNNRRLQQHNQQSYQHNQQSYQQTSLSKQQSKSIFAPDSINTDLSKLESDIQNEYAQFEQEERQRRKAFEDKQMKKKEYIQKQINSFETEFNPYEILEIHKSEATIDKVKKQYKKMALKYHPDKAGAKYEGKFQLITQSYIYLLNKLEQDDQQKNKTTQKVVKKTYENDLNDGMVNMYVDKDKFDINRFNEIFEKYKIPDVHDDGYGDLMKGKDDLHSKKDENAVFGKNFNQAIFNAHFDELKSKKVGTDVIAYREPEALDLNSLGCSELGVSKVNDYGTSSMGGSLGFSDYKKAHIDETLLINPNSVKLKQYKDVNQLESERSNISFQASREDIEYRERIERKRQEDESNRLHQMKLRDSMIENHYNKMNKKLIVNK